MMVKLRLGKGQRHAMVREKKDNGLVLLAGVGKCLHDLCHAVVGTAMKSLGWHFSPWASQYLEMYSANIAHPYQEVRGAVADNILAGSRRSSFSCLCAESDAAQLQGLHPIFCQTGAPS